MKIANRYIFFAFFACAFCLIFKIDLRGQSARIPLNKSYYHLIDRYEIKRKYFLPDVFTFAKPYQRKNVASFISAFLKDSSRISSQADYFNMAYLKNDNWEWIEEETGNSKKVLLKWFYIKKNDLFYIQKKGFDIHINPVLHLSVGQDNSLSSRPFINTRGIEIRGNLKKKIGFYLFITDSQIRFPRYGQDENARRSTVIGEGFWKKFSNDGVDFLTARGYINFQILEAISLEFGHNKHFFGNGYRSLVLSDFSNDYLYLKATLQVWKLRYTILHGNLIADNTKSSGGFFPRKALAFHHLNIRLAPNFSLGLFESIIYSRQDSINTTPWDIEYFNPIIFYRYIEQHIGDSDNAFLGLDFKWNILKKFQIYGQWIIDELIVKEILNNRGWWGNKFGVQLGFKYIDALGISNLDWQLETNIVRPYTYTHFNSGKSEKFTNYQHYNQPLSHPLGSNFYELISILRYQPWRLLTTSVKFFYAYKGMDIPSSRNWGSNIFKPYTTREREYGNFIGQGVLANLYFLDLLISFQMKHNFFVELKHTYRKYQSENRENNTSTHFTALSIRWNIPQRLWEF